MTLAYLCLVIAIFIPLICAGYAKISVKGYDNRHPREFLSKLEGKAKRAHYAQQNSFEAFAPFAAGVIVAHQLHAAQSTINALALIFIISRTLYCIFYIIDQHVWRSAIWFVGLLSTIALFFIGAN